ncbi:MAG: quinone oxidoreductase family protein [Alphaproteobacteria bacterium]|jgi:NADPH2:quinone reductase
MNGTAITKAIRVHEYGGPDTLQFDEIPLEGPGHGEVLIRHRAIGVNYADIHTRNGRYPLPSLPHVIGGEGVGIVEELGVGVDHLRIGDRVAYSSGGHALPRGSYAEARVLSADRLIVMPDEIEDETAAAMITKGLTAHYLLHDVFRVQPGQTILMHAAAGGVGVIMCQWARYLGARVIGIVSSEAKAEIALAHGCHHALVGDIDSIPARVRALTAGEGVPVVFDSVGQDTFEASLHSLRPRGTLVSFGTASGPIPPLDIFRLNEMGSLYVTSAAFHWHLRNREEVLARAADLIDVVLRGAVRIPVNQRYPLADAAQAHRDMESRATTGMSVLIP